MAENNSFVEISEIESVFQNQKDYFFSEISKDIPFRKKQLKSLKSALKANEDLIFDAIYADFKKSRFETFATELALLYLDIDEALKNLSSWTEDKFVGTNLPNFPGKSFIKAEPLGVCLVISAWNYPIQLAIAPCIPALAAGNTVILKPSEIAPNCSRVLAKIINETFDSRYFHVIEGGVEETQILLKLRFDKIFFTGSTQVGKIVYEAASKNLIPVTLELGGKSPAIFTENCNWDMCVRRLVWAKFLNAGQTCIAPDYVLVPRDHAEKLIDLIKSYLVKFDYSFENENYVQIINDKNVKRLKNLLEPSSIRTGGTVDEQNRYFEPTILYPVSWEDKCMQEEIFGPILPIIPYDSLDETIAKIKGGEKPLALYVFSKDQKKIDKIMNSISFGGGGINEAMMHISNSELPFGGVGHSGMGTYHGEAGFREFSHYKSIFKKATWLESSVKYPPYSNWKLKILRWFAH